MPRSRSRRRDSRRRSPRRRSPPARRSSSERSFTPEWRKRKRNDEEKSQNDEQKDENDEITSGVVDGIPRSSGEATYRAEVNVPRDNGSNTGPSGKRGLTAIRGPNRIDRDKAHEDVRLLVDAFKRGGPPEVRKTQKELNRSWVN